MRIKPVMGTCSLGQDGLPETAGKSWRAMENRRSALGPFRDVQKEQGPNHQLFHEARKGVPTHRAGTP
jgi:hypothetical protein